MLWRPAGLAVPVTTGQRGQEWRENEQDDPEKPSAQGLVQRVRHAAARFPVMFPAPCYLHFPSVKGSMNHQQTI